MATLAEIPRLIPPQHQRALRLVLLALTTHLDSILHDSLAFARQPLLQPPIRSLVAHLLSNLIPRIRALHFPRLVAAFVHLVTRSLLLRRSRSNVSADTPLPFHPGFTTKSSSKLAHVDPNYLRTLFLRLAPFLLPPQDLASPILVSFLADTVVYSAVAPLFYSVAQPASLKRIIHKLVQSANKKDGTNDAKQPPSSSSNIAVNPAREDERQEYITAPTIDLIDALLDGPNRPRISALLSLARAASLISPVVHTFDSKALSFLHDKLLSPQAIQDIVPIIIETLDEKLSKNNNHNNVEQDQENLNEQDIQQVLIEDLSNLIQDKVHPSILSFFFPDLASSKPTLSKDEMTYTSPRISLALATELVSLLDDHALNVHMVLHLIDYLVLQLFPELSSPSSPSLP